ncbi:hypothetical protein [Ruegeria faecimaris]|uniref:Uncharacterized protein n=1 Tax=Ruegeria faecimaris TaxID=686389 RepID=A0A521FEH4_9RHOB|nr:hypothetical protein [Ruegeria faecimaris]SMO94596.1 hypothetical protein SAMN06265380_1216 [Ruegeria faecimaris]
MTTQLVFENRSLNPNVRRVGLFWDCLDHDQHIRPLTWQVVLQCPYRWYRSFQIDLTLSVRFVNREGNISPDVLVDRKVVCGEATIEPRRKGDGIDLTITVPKGHRLHKVQVVRCGFPLTETRLPLQGECVLRAPDRLNFAADMTTRQGFRIDRREIGPGVASFDLHHVQAMRVAMYGGTPGPKSDPINFFGYDIQYS